jgi:hypothetical protein
MSVFQELERYVPPDYLDDWRRWVAYSAKYEPSDEIGHICQTAGWLALLTCETPSNLAEQNSRFLEAISAKFQADQANRVELQKSVTILTEAIEEELQKLRSVARSTNEEIIAGVNKSVGRLRGEMEKLKTMRRSIWVIGLLLAWLGGILTHIGFSWVFH